MTDTVSPRTRRSILAAAAAAAGAIAARSLSVATPVEAANGSTVKVGQVNSGTQLTTLRNTGAVGNAVAIKGFVTTTGVGTTTAGVYGQSNARGGRGVVGQADTGASSKGVYGRSVAGRGVQGEALGTSGENYGVYGKTASFAGTGVHGEGGRYGVRGVASGSGVYGTGTIGIQGEGTTGVNGFSSVEAGNGVIARADDSTGYGIWGISDDGEAGHFSGDVVVTGTLTKAGGSFLIDHPQDPANRTLEHSFVEAPERLNVYSGTVTLNTKGRATVRLPEYFGALNRDIRYQLTPIGAPAPELHVAKEVQGRTFAIAGGSPDQKVCWQVTGVRQDAWAKQHPLRVDRAK